MKKTLLAALLLVALPALGSEYSFSGDDATLFLPSGGGAAQLITAGTPAAVASGGVALVGGVLDFAAGGDLTLSPFPWGGGDISIEFEMFVPFGQAHVPALFSFSEHTWLGLKYGKVTSQFSDGVSKHSAIGHGAGYTEGQWHHVRVTWGGAHASHRCAINGAAQPAHGGSSFFVIDGSIFHVGNPATIQGGQLVIGGGFRGKLRNVQVAF